MILTSRLVSFHRISAYLILVVLSTSCTSAPPTGLGLVNGRLAPCPVSPNCVCSEDSGIEAHINPLSFVSGERSVAWVAVQRSVKEIGGTIERVNDSYLWATFRSRLFRFVDDLELRMDAKQGVVHVRSASRLGYSDFGANRKRVELLRKSFVEKMGSHNRP